MATRRRSVRLLLAIGLGCVGLTVLCAPAAAYRPFDGTDAAVADFRAVEVELQPAGVLKQGPAKTLVGPAWVVNLGIAEGWEAVFQGQGQFPLGASDERASFGGAGAFLKHVWREGSLQDKTGPSFATEFGVLLPGINADDGLGFSAAGIVSQRWDWGTIHLNLQTELTRDQHADTFIGTIIEGPHTWKVRPVAEFFYENEFTQTQTMSALAGAIWQVNDNVSFDVGIRHAWVLHGEPINEVRVGVTFGIPNLLGAGGR